MSDEYTHGESVMSTAGRRVGALVRRATGADLDALAVMGEALALQHRSYDAARFVLPPGGRRAFRDFFEAEMTSRRSIVLVAVCGDRIDGYAFARVEEASIPDLADESVWLHDLYVDESARGFGIGPDLIRSVIAFAREQGIGSVRLHVSPVNARAAGLFGRYGFRHTMSELTITLDGRDQPTST